MPDIAWYVGVVSIGFVLLTTLVMAWFAFIGEREESHKPTVGETDPDTTE